MQHTNYKWFQRNFIIFCGLPNTKALRRALYTSDKPKQDKALTHTHIHIVKHSCRDNVCAGCSKGSIVWLTCHLALRFARFLLLNSLKPLSCSKFTLSFCAQQFVSLLRTIGKLFWFVFIFVSNFFLFVGLNASIPAAEWLLSLLSIFHCVPFQLGRVCACVEGIC